MASVSARLGYVLNNAVRSGHREHVLRDLVKIESGEIARDQIPSIWEKVIVQSVVQDKISRRMSDAAGPLRLYRSAGGEVLFSVRSSGESGPVVRFVKAAAAHVDDVFLADLQELLVRRIDAE